MELLEEDIKRLLSIKTETKNIDYKESLIWASGKNDQKLNIVKDILAMANTQDGGNIIIGVRDSNYECVGIPEEDYDSFDQTKVNDFLHNYTEPRHSCQVYKHTIDSKNIVVIYVPEFEDVPIICKNDANSIADPNKLILKKGQIYIRTDKATSGIISSAEEMREFLGRAISKKGDELLHTIDRLIKGKPLKPTDESKEKYDAEIKEAEVFLSENIGEELKKYGHWAIYAYPTEYVPNRISDQRIIKELIEKTEVDLRGWNFPHTDVQDTINFTRGRQSYTIWDRFIEGYRAYKSSLFVCKKAFWEDVQGYTSNDDRLILSIPNLIWSITEFFLFFKRYYEEIAQNCDLSVKLVLNQTKNRKLGYLDHRDVFLRGSFIAKENSICIEEPIKVVELRASFKEIANSVILQIFRVFNCNDITEEYIGKWQNKLLEGKA